MQAAGARLDEHVAERGRLDRTGDDRHARRRPRSAGRAACSGRRRRRGGRRRSDRPDSRAASSHGSARRPRPGCRGCSGRAPAAMAGGGAGRPRGRPPRSAPACRPAAGTTGSSGSIGGPPGGQLAGGDEQRRQVLGRARQLPGPQRLLEQPQAHDVAQVADPVVDAALVGEVRRAALLGQDRRVELDADERPGAAGDVRERRSSPAGTPTTADAVSCEPTSVTERLGAMPRSRRARRRAAGRRRRPALRAAAKIAPGSPSAPMRSVVPAPAMDVEQRRSSMRS